MMGDMIVLNPCRVYLTSHKGISMYFSWYKSVLVLLKIQDHFLNIVFFFYKFQLLSPYVIFSEIQLLNLLIYILWRNFHSEHNFYFLILSILQFPFFSFSFFFLVFLNECPASLSSICQKGFGTINGVDTFLQRICTLICLSVQQIGRLQSLLHWIIRWNMFSTYFRDWMLESMYCILFFLIIFVLRSLYGRRCQDEMEFEWEW